MNADLGDDTAGNVGTGEAGGPASAVIVGTEDVAVGGSDEDQLGVGIGEFEGGNGGVIEKIGDGTPICAIVDGTPKAAGGEPKLLGIMGRGGANGEEGEGAENEFLYGERGGLDVFPAAELETVGEWLAGVMTLDFGIGAGGEDFEGIGGIEDHPAAIAGEDAGEIVAVIVFVDESAVGLDAGDEGTGVLGAAAEDAAIGGADVDVVEHGGDEAAGAILPRDAAVLTDGDAAVVAGEDHLFILDDEGMLVGVDEIGWEFAGRAAVAFTGGDAMPIGAAVAGEVNIYDAAHDEIGVSGVDGDGVVVIDLSFVFEGRSVSQFPGVTAVGGFVNAF